MWTFAFESPAVHIIAAAVLESSSHKSSVELVRSLQEWQRASAELEAARAAEASASQSLADITKLWQLELTPVGGPNFSTMTRTAFTY